MSLDLGQILDLAGGFAAELIETSGTEVSIWRNPAGATDTVTNRATLARTDPTPPVKVADELPALVIPAAAGGQDQDGPNLLSRVDAYTVLLLPDVVDVLKHDQVTIDLCRDERLLGRTLKVLRVADGTAGVVRGLVCEVP